MIRNHLITKFNDFAKGRLLNSGEGPKQIKRQIPYETSDDKNKGSDSV